MNFKVVVTDHEFDNFENEERLASEVGATLEVFNVLAEEDLLRATRGANVLLVSYANISRKVLQGLAEDAVVIQYSIGYDNVDMAAAAELGVRICNVPDYGAHTVADHTVMLMLALIRRALEYHHAIVDTAGGWVQALDVGPIVDLTDTTVGLVGTGQIGRLVAKRIQGFGSRVVAYDPYADPALLTASGIEPLSFDDLLATADVVSMHAPLTAETTGMIGVEEIARMKPSAVLVNTARGGLIDIDAAVRAVNAERLGGLGLDVFPSEPLEEGHPLRSARRTLLTPHAAYYSERSVRNLQLFAAEEMARACRGEGLRCEVRYKPSGSSVQV